MKDELLRLRRQVDELTIQLQESTMRGAPSDNSIFAQGGDLVTITYSFSECTSRVQLTWDYMIRVILPLTYGGGADSDAIARALRRAVAEYERDNSFDDSDHLSAAGADFKVSHSEYAKVVNQMFALGLIEPRPHPTLPASTIWFATPYGCRFSAKMVAIRRDLPGPATT